MKRTKVTTAARIGGWIALLTLTVACAAEPAASCPVRLDYRGTSYLGHPVASPPNPSLVGRDLGSAPLRECDDGHGPETAHDVRVRSIGNVDTRVALYAPELAGGTVLLAADLTEAEIPAAIRSWLGATPEENLRPAD